MEQNWKSVAKKHQEFTNMWKLNSTLLIHQWVKKEITGEIREHLATNGSEQPTPKRMQSNEAVLERGLQLRQDSWPRRTLRSPPV